MITRRGLQVAAVFTTLVFFLAFLIGSATAFAIDTNPCLSESSRKPITSADYFNHDIAVMKEQGVQADLVLVGASRVYRSYIPQEIEDGLNLDVVINGGTSAQPTFSSCCMLYQLIDMFHPKYAVVGLTWGSFIDEPLVNGVLIAGDFMTRYMKVINAEMQLSANDLQLLDDNIRYSANADKEEDIKAQRKALVESEYSNTELTKGDYYKDTGFVLSTASQEQGNIEMGGKRTWKASKVTDANLASLDAICSLCEKNDVKLYFVVTPTSMMRTYGLIGYDKADAYMNKYAVEHNAVFFDLNLMRDREKKLPDSLMRDNNHVNAEGAKIVTQCLVDCIRADLEGKGVSEYLYDSVEELKADCNRVVAIKADIAIDGNAAKVSINSMQNEDIDPLYRVLIATSDSDYKVIKDWTHDAECIISVPSGSSFTIKVVAAKNTEDKEPAWMTYSF